MKDFLKYKAYIFDLDNTLYDENDYLLIAYKSIAHEVNSLYGTGYLVVAHFLYNTFIDEGRKHLFDKMISRFELPREAMNICLHHLRKVEAKEQILLKENMELLLKKLLNDKKKVFVLTNGNIQQQKNKVAAMTIR